MSLADELRERIAIAEAENAELWERINSEPRPVTNMEMLEVIRGEVEWFKGSPRRPGRYYIEFAGGDCAGVYKYGFGEGRVHYEHNGEEVVRVIAWHYPIPPRKMGADE